VKTTTNTTAKTAITTQKRCGDPSRISSRFSLSLGLRCICICTVLGVAPGFGSIGYAAEDDNLELTLPSAEESQTPDTAGSDSLDSLNEELRSINNKIDVTKHEVDKIRDASYLVDLYFSLADLQVQKARLLYLIKARNSADKKMDEIDFTAEKRPKQEAIDLYQKILNFFPTSNKLDQALFLEGIEHRDLGQMDLMVRRFTELSRKYPQSEHFNEANIIVGDYFLEQKKDFDGAIEIFSKVTARPLTAFTPIAYYRIGYCQINKLNNEGAVRAFESAIAEQQKLLTAAGPDGASGVNGALPAMYRKTNIQREAVMALVVPYIELYADTVKPRPKGFVAPLTYFKQKSPDHFTYRRVLGKVGRRLLIKEKFREASEVFYNVLGLSTDFDTKFDALQRINEARKKHQAQVDLLGLVKEIGNSVDLLQVARPDQSRLIIWNAALAKKVEQHIKAVKNKSDVLWAPFRQMGFLEALMRDSSTQLQARARTTGSAQDFAQAAEAYEIYLDKFPASAKLFEIKQNRAESLFKSTQWVRAGMSYEDVAANKLSGVHSGEFKESAIEAYTKALQETDKLSLIEKIRAREGLRAVAADWIRSNPNRPGAATAAFNIGNSWYQERNLKKAIESFGSYIRHYPKDGKVRDAIFLIVNSYSQLDDNKGLENAASQLGKTPGLAAEDKQALAAFIRKAQTKQLQAIGGDFGSKEYAANLLSVASKYKGSTLGVQALYEAFSSMKSNRNPEVFDVGDALLEQHADSQYAKEVSSTLAQLALSTASYDRAARYLAHFADKYPSDKESTGFRKTAATLYDRQGDYKQARIQYGKLGDNDSVSRMDFALSDWAALEKSSQAPGVLQSTYWHALALWRQKREADAVPLLKQLASKRGGSADQAGHAKFLLIQLDLERFRAIQMKRAEDQAALVAKVENFNALSKNLQQLIQTGSGKWPIAALYLLGQSDYELSRFIADSPMPKGLSKADESAYIAALGQQANVYGGEAKKAFAKCTEAAEAGNVFTRYVEGCRAGGTRLIREEDDLAPGLSSQPELQLPRIAAIRRELFKGSDIKLLFELGDIYLRSGRSQVAASIYSRILELESGNARALGSQGVAQLQLGQNDAAYQSFNVALEKNSTEAVALYNLASLERHFQFMKNLGALQKKLASVPRPAVVYNWPK
jgi:TolA-binding protein